VPVVQADPDIHGSYVNGTWSPIASMPAGYGPLYFGSAVLPDGRVVCRRRIRFRRVSLDTPRRDLRSGHQHLVGHAPSIGVGLGSRVPYGSSYAMDEHRRCTVGRSAGWEVAAGRRGRFNIGSDACLRQRYAGSATRPGHVDLVEPVHECPEDHAACSDIHDFRQAV
jgi:hypothetical protein